MANVHHMALTSHQADQMFDYEANHERVAHGWRQGKPIEDPEKTKRWGFVTAKPSEYLIHMRRGRILRRSTGQGASCFKWPWDSIAIIPTTINRLQFAADQVTLEKVGVRVSGLAVYRIVEPEIAFRMLNFSFSERATEKLADILREMFVGATRRHVANLTVEEVITRRKDAIAGELMAELAPLMRGHGQSEDSTPMGWGVILDTVEIQDVRVLSDAVFRDMQAEFRSALALRARHAELQTAKEVAAHEAASAREIDEARISSEAATRQMRAQAESRIAEAERELIETRHQNQLRERELEAALSRLRARDQAELREAESLAQEVIRRRELELERVTGDVQTELLGNRSAIENSISDDRIRMTLVKESLPAMAQAFATQFGEVRFTHIGGEGNDPSAMIARSLAQVFEMARALGLRLGSAPESASK